MALNDRLVNDTDESSPTIDGVTAGNDAAGTTLLMQRVKRHTLSAKVLVDAETSTITLTPIWQVSRDDTTFFDVHPQNGAAYVIQATGTGGADPSVTRVLDAPLACYGYLYTRVVIRVGVATGTAVDSATIGYSYQDDNVV